MHYEEPLWVHKSTVASGATEVIAPMPAPLQWATLTVFPHSGCTAVVQFTLSPAADIAGGTAEWKNWSQGPVTADAADVFDGPITGLRISATGGACGLGFTQ